MPIASDMPAPSSAISAIQEPILAWYASQARDLPWRHTRDPYAVLVSEVMLQQTQVDRVIPKYHEFLKRFPTLEALAVAPLSEVLRAWSPLGYNRRARNLQLAARATLERHEGQLPPSVQDLRALPGIGRYTASAVACFAFELDVATVDTNIRRILTRTIQGSNESLSEAAVWKLAETALPNGRGYSWNQALMDLGATVCTAATPRCTVCPVQTSCAWASLGELTPKRRALVAEEPGAYAVREKAGALRRRARGFIVQALRELAPGDYTSWTDIKARMQQHIPQSESLDQEAILESLRADGLIHQHPDAPVRAIALAP